MGKKHIFEYERLSSLKYRTESSFMTLQSVEYKVCQVDVENAVS